MGIGFATLQQRDLDRYGACQGRVSQGWYTRFALGGVEPHSQGVMQRQAES